MNFAIMCSGGDSAGMNPAIKKFVDYGYKKGIKTYFIYNGLEGLIDNNIKEATFKDVAGIVHLGGTVIKTSRSKRFFKSSFRKKAYDNLKKLNIKHLIVLGGDGSFRAMQKFSSEYKDINFVGVPSTIDNDIYPSEYCLGVDSALNVIRDALDKIRDTASSFNRAFVIEVMGRECGYLAAVSSLTSGAEICLIPELKTDYKSLKTKLKQEIKNGRSYIIAIVAEGTKNTKKLAKWIEKELKLETRITILGHIQRGGNPSVKDRLMAFEFIVKSIDFLLENKNSNKIIVYKNGDFSFVDINQVVQKSYKIPSDIIESLKYID
jgi:6-phosphofructokinase 1